jgi:hypothetical protein
MPGESTDDGAHCCTDASADGSGSGGADCGSGGSTGCGTCGASRYCADSRSYWMRTWFTRNGITVGVFLSTTFFIHKIF